jgi:uncharacterized protein (DUF433 family)
MQTTLDRITINPLMMGGRPCIRGMRITVGNIVGLLSAGHTAEEILDEFPDLEQEDIFAALAYASCRVQEREVALPINSERFTAVNADRC